MTKIENLQDGLNRRMNMTEDITGQLEDRSRNPI